MSRKPYVEGDWFGVPLKDGYVLGRIARVGRRGGLLLGYFFEPLLPAAPTIDDTFNLGPGDAFNIGRFGDLGLVKEGWPIISSRGSWNREDWPMPLLGRVVGLSPGLAYAVRYDDRELTQTLGKVRVTVEQALGLPKDNVAGHVWLQERLGKYFREGQEAYDSNERKKSYSWFHGLPRE